MEYLAVKESDVPLRNNNGVKREKIQLKFTREFINVPAVQ